MLKRILTIGIVLAFAVAARADTLLPYQFGNRLLILGPGVGCGALQLDYSDATGCNTVGIVLRLP